MSERVVPSKPAAAAGSAPSVIPAAAPPAAVTDVASLVDAVVGELLAAEVDRWSAFDPALRSPFEHLEAFVVRGGKRLRPAFCYWGFVAAGGRRDAPEVVAAGAALELLHAFALVHDDVMDGSSHRRGRPTVHRSFAALHRDGRWSGESRRYGEGVAILLGDLAHVYADRLVADAEPPARALWHELRIELNVGQYLDLAGTASGDVDLAQARRIARYKSGRYTIERPLQLGAALAGHLPELAEALSAYGAPLGEAFQHRDDLLGAFGDPSVTGKPVGDDFREGKPTPLLAVARELATPAQRDVLDSVGRPGIGDDDVARVREVLQESGARAAIEELIEELTAEALAALEAAAIAPAARVPLEQLARYVAARST